MTKIFNIKIRLDGRVESIAATATGNGKKWQEVILFGCGEERFQYHWTEGPPGELVSVYVSDCGRHYCDARVVRTAITGWLNYIRDIRKIKSRSVNLHEAYEDFPKFKENFQNQSRVSLSRTEWDYHSKTRALTAAGFKYEKESGKWARPQV